MLIEGHPTGQRASVLRHSRSGSFTTSTNRANVTASSCASYINEGLRGVDYQCPVERHLSGIPVLSSRSPAMQIVSWRYQVQTKSLGANLNCVTWYNGLRSSYTTRTKCAISDAFVRDCVFAFCASVVQYVYSLSAEHCFGLRKNAITDERVRDCAHSTHSVFRPLPMQGD